MKIAIAADHAGFPLKAPLIELIRELGHEPLDLGAHEYDKDDDYPDFARYVAQAIQHGQAERGILVCGSGVGASIAANKIHGIRASVCHDTYTARQGVQHDAMNILCVGNRVIGEELVREIVRSFITAEFSGEQRHCRRLEKINAMEAGG